jgi:hypothetical protein
MADGERPSGLTVLGQINLILALMQGIQIIGLCLGSALESAAMASAAVRGTSAQEEIAYLHRWLPEMITVLAMSSSLLVASGVGLLRMRRALGRHCGNAYALLSVGQTALALTAMHEPFDIASIIGLVYPALLLLWLNLIFRGDLVH